ncbi:DUF3800 domain-containing protein [Isoptericola sp. S6320L]|uniref:DUF3800 domain-containing protein n=1 Tax=Isoptericola sp. S6320L TaxID=2926411 RepID=UPI001FF6B70F|nr:DUF3800 domain-containing protein [Isoptericola sp. S6320L]MCK0116283.1 DUF3800 domain-containing protein [Isoptericola sp. S6320L]
MGALLVDTDAACSIEKGLDELVTTDASQSGLASEAELHGYELFHGKGDWAKLAMRQQINVYDRALRIIGGSGAKILFRGMDVKAQIARYVDPFPPHDITLGHLLESINEACRADNEYAVVVADEVHAQDRHRTNFRDYRRTGTPGYQSSTLPNVIDTIHFGPSAHSRLLQAIDLATFVYRRRCTVRETNPKARVALDRMWGHIEPAVRVQWVWRP